MCHPTGPRVGSKQWAAGSRQDRESKRGGPAVAVSPEAPAEPVPCSLFPALAGSPEALAVPQLDAEDSVLVANAEQREVFSECPFKLDDLVL